MYQLLDSQGIVAIREIPSRDPVFGRFPESIAGPVAEALRSTGVGAPYLHQEEAMNHIWAGRNVIVTTGTASGKSLIYTAPVFSALVEDTGARAVYIAPTKALGQNQRHKMQALADEIHWPGRVPAVSVCDGDTPREQRQSILREAGVILTTPDFLHYVALPNHRMYPELFQNLKYIVIDEAHYYVGVLGNHFCQVLRRLRRLCRLYGSRPVFVLCSATIANPLEFARNLTGVAHELVKEETSPAGPKTVVFYVPPRYGDGNNARRRNAVLEAARIVAAYTGAGHRVIMFGRSRNVVETAYRKVLKDLPENLRDHVSPYKGTYTQEVRREVEAGLLSGKLTSVLTTNALELGIDIGSMSVCVLSFPGSIASTWQQAGRVGRSGQKSLIVLIASEDPLEMYLVNNPDYFFGQPCENAVVNPRQLQFICDHLPLAAAESLLVKEDADFWGEQPFFSAVKLVRNSGAIRLIKKNGARAYLPASNILYFGLRSESRNFNYIGPQGQVIEQAEYKDVLVSGYPGAILLSRGNEYLVGEIDYESNSVKLLPLPQGLKGFTTSANIRTTIDNVIQEEKREFEQVVCGLGEVRVRRAIEGYYLRSPQGKVESKPLNQHIVPVEMTTVAYWLDFPGSLLDRFSSARRHGAIHAVEHLLRVVAPWRVLCDRADIGTHFEIDGSRARIYLYDNYSGGVGICESLPDLTSEILTHCLEIVGGCFCVDGCPGCIHIPKCEQSNDDLDKEGALLLLAGALNKKREARAMRSAMEKQPSQKIDRAGIKRAARREERRIKRIDSIEAAEKASKTAGELENGGPENFRRLAKLEKQVALMIYLLAAGDTVDLVSIAAGAAQMGLDDRRLRLILENLVAHNVINHTKDGYGVWRKISKYLAMVNKEPGI